MPHNPRVSICIPSYNHARFLQTALESALSQTYQDFEIVVVDDGSTDDSLRIATDYAARHPSIVQVFSHPDRGHQGISATVNLAFKKSRGEYWCGLPSDDVFYPYKLEEQVAFLETHRDIGFVYGYAATIDEAGHLLPEIMGADISASPDPVARLISGNAIWGMTVLARRDCVEKVGLHDETLVYSDWDLWIRILAHYKVGFMNRPLAMWRIHSNNTSIGNPSMILQYSMDLMKALLRKAPEIGGAFASPRSRAKYERLIRANIATYLLWMAAARADQGDSETAKACLIRSLRNFPVTSPTWLRDFAGMFGRLYFPALFTFIQRKRQKDLSTIPPQ